MLPSCDAIANADARRPPTKRVAINPRICEGCGDCGRKSGCLSVQPVATPFGRKTRIDQTSCNLDYSCLEGDCPSFMTVSPRPAWQRRLFGESKPSPEVQNSAGRALASPPPEPPLPADPTSNGASVAPERFALRMTGVGGTGVVTVSQLLGTAAGFDGYEVRGLDQIGLVAKGRAGRQ